VSLFGLLCTLGLVQDRHLADLLTAKCASEETWATGTCWKVPYLWLGERNVIEPGV
jgi:hypothetical protein